MVNKFDYKYIKILKEETKGLKKGFDKNKPLFSYNDTVDMLKCVEDFYSIILNDNKKEILVELERVNINLKKVKKKNGK